MRQNTWFYRFIYATITINTVMICMLTFWAIDGRQTLQVVQVEVQELKHRIEMEIKLRQELLPEIKKSAKLLSRYNPGLDPFTALSYAIKIWQCSDEIVTNDLLTSLIVIESSANQNAISPKGALGLTQIMPGFWQYEQNELRDPYKNIEAGAAILRQYIQRYGLVDGLRAYNCGTPRNQPDDASMKYAQKILQTAENHF